MTRYTIWATPPNANNVIALVLNPRARATMACDISCASSVTKNKMDVRTESAQMVLEPYPGSTCWNCEPKDMVMSRAMTNQL